MTITYREFIQSLLLGAKLLDEHPFLKIEEMTWNCWKFSDEGAHYIQPEERGNPNPSFYPDWSFMRDLH